MESKPTNGELRIGVFVCDCGLNIAGAVDCEDVTEFAKTIGDQLEQELGWPMREEAGRGGEDGILR